MVDRKTATIAALCVVTVLCIGLWLNSAQEASKLKGGLYELEVDYDKLARVRTSLEENYSELRTEKEELQERYMEMLAIDQENQLLKQQVIDLEAEMSIMQDDYQDIEDEYYTLQSNNEELQENYDVLQAAFESLNQSHSDLLSCLEETEEEEIDEGAHVWIYPIDATASGYTTWGGAWYTGPPHLAIDGNMITAWTLNDMGEITFDLGSEKVVSGIEAYWGGHVTNGNTVNVYVDGKQVLSNEQFGATGNFRYFDPVRGRFIRYQTVALPHNKYLQIASWSEIAEFKVFVEEGQ